MPADTPKLDPDPLIWLGFAALAFALSAFAPAWTAAACLPVAGLVSWLSHQRRAARELARLHRIADSIAGIGAAAPETTERDAPAQSDTPDDKSAIDRLERLVAQRHASIENAIVRQLESQALLRANLNAVDTPLIATDESGRVTRMNRAAERLFSSRPRRVEGVPIDELLTNSALLELHARAERGEACRQRIRLTLDGQSRIHEISAIPVRLDIADIPARVPQRAGVVLTLRDVHELAQTLQLRTDFAANASHELRTPIASIRTAIETIKGPAMDDPEMRARVFGMVENNIARLEEMVHDLLDLSRLESEDEPVRAEPFDGRELADSLVSIFQDACAKKRVELVMDLDPGLSSMRTDRKLLLLILRNLIDNAIKFAFEDTAVRVTGRVVPTAGGPIAGARFAVADRGVGIPLKHQQRIFERFFQIDESRARLGGRRGSGLGLAIVRHALRRLDGEITVESVWHEGTTMTVEIPRCVRRAETQETEGIAETP